MKELIQNVLVYIILVSALRGLVSNPKYQQYFQFFSGMILILFLITPVLQLFHGEETWYNSLEQKLLQMDLADVEQKMAVAQESFSKMVVEEYRAAVAEQAKALAAQKGITLQNMEIILSQKNEEINLMEIRGTVVKSEETSVEEIQGTVEKNGETAVEEMQNAMANNEEASVEEIQGTVEKNGENNLKGPADAESQISIPAIQIGRQENQTAAGEEDNSEEAVSLRREFAGYFMIGEEQVHLWK